MPISLDSFMKVAQDISAKTNYLPSGDDSTIRLDGDDLALGRWQSLGTRSGDFKSDNQKLRDALYKSLTAEFGDLDALPQDIKDKIKLNDFIAKDGVVTSKRPLTARRIVAIANAVTDLRAERQQLERLNSMPPGAEASDADKNAIAKEMSLEESGQANVQGSMKLQHALIALDGLKNVHDNPPQWQPNGTNEEKLADYMGQVAARVGDLVANVTSEAFKYGVQELKAHDEHKPIDDIPKPASFARYGKHSYGADDFDFIARGMLKALLATDPKLQGMLKKIDTKRFNEILEQQSDQMSKLSDAYAEGQFDFKIAKVKVEDAEKKNDPKLEELKIQRDKQAQALSDLGTRKVHVTMQGCLLSAFAVELTGGKSSFD